MSRQVLVVDENPTAAALLERQLAGCGYEAVLSRGSVAALEVLRSPRPPRMMIGPWDMPRTEGPVLCRAIRADRRIPRVYCILHADAICQADVLDAQEAGADDLIQRPFEHPQLLRRLRAGQCIIDLEHELARHRPPESPAGQWVIPLAASR